MASTIPKEVKKEIVDAWIAEITWKVALFISTLNRLTQNLYSGCTNEVSGTGYTAGGTVLAGRNGAYVDTTNQRIDATDTAWTTATFSDVQFLVVYETTGSKIRAIYDLGTTYAVTSGTFTVQWNNAGLIKVS